MRSSFRTVGPLLAGLAFVLACGDRALAAQLGVTVRATAPASAELLPPPGVYPTDVASYRAGVERATALGLRVHVALPGDGLDLETGYHVACGAGFNAGDADRERLNGSLSAADAAGASVYVAGVEVSKAGRPVPPAEQAPLVEMAVKGTLDALGSHPSLAGLIWAVPDPEQVAVTATPAEAEAAARAWADGVSAVAAVCGRTCSEVGRSFVLLTGSVPLVAAAVPRLPDGVVVWRSVTVPRAPTVAWEVGALEAAALGPSGGLLCDYESPATRTAARTAVGALAAGVQTVIVGDISLALRDDGPPAVSVLSRATPSLTESVREAAKMAGALADSASSDVARRPFEADALLVVEPRAELYHRVAPDAGEPPDQVAPTLALLNEAGRSVAFALEPPPVQARPAGDSEPDADRAQLVCLCNAARAGDAFLDSFFECADRGYTVAHYGDVATVAPEGGPRTTESKNRQAGRLPFNRGRVFREPVDGMRFIKDLEGTQSRRLREVKVPPGDGQWIFRGEAREGTEVLAEWFKVGSPAYSVATRGAGRVLGLNGAPGLARANVLSDVLTHLGIGTSRPLPAKDETKSLYEEPRFLDRHGLIPAIPREPVLPTQVIPPPELPNTTAAAESQSAYDAFFSRRGVRFASFGYRPPDGDRLQKLGRLVVDLGAWDYCMTARDLVLTSGPELRVPAGDSASVYDLSSDSFVRVLYRPDKVTICSRPGLYAVDSDAPDHVLVDAGGAAVILAQREAAGDALLLAVDRPAVLQLALDPEKMAGKRASVAIISADGETVVPLALASPQWWITCDSRLIVDALARVPIRVTFDEVTEDAERCEAFISPGAGAERVTLDGGPAVLLDRYSNAEADATFEHWSAPEARNTLSLVGVVGDLYGRGARGSDEPAKLRVTVNGREVYAADVPYQTLRIDGRRDEWEELVIPLPREALRRGLNRVVVVNEGPNAVALASAAVRFRKPEEGGS